MIAITTSSSIRVNPRFFICPSWAMMPTGRGPFVKQIRELALDSFSSQER